MVYVGNKTHIYCTAVEVIFGTQTFKIKYLNIMTHSHNSSILDKCFSDTCIQHFALWFMIMCIECHRLVRPKHKGLFCCINYRCRTTLSCTPVYDRSSAISRELLSLRNCILFCRVLIVNSKESIILINHIFKHRRKPTVWDSFSHPHQKHMKDT